LKKKSYLHIRKWLVVVCLILLGVTTGKAQDNVEPRTANEKAEAFFLEGVRLQLRRDYDQAYELFSHALYLNPNHVGALYELSNYAHYMHNDSLATVLMEKAASLDTGNYYIKQALVNLYVNQKRDSDAILQLESMAKQYPRKSEVLFMLVDMYKKKDDFQHVVKTLDRIELLEGKSEMLSTEKFRIYAQMKDMKRAFAEMNALAEEYPNDLRYRVLIGDLYLDDGKPEKAYEVYSKLEKEEPDNVNLLLSLASYYQQQNNDSLYQNTLERLVTNNRLDYETRFHLIQSITYQSLQQQVDTAQVMPLFRQMLAAPQEDSRVAELCARYMITNGAPSSATKPVLRQVLAIDPEVADARSQLLIYAVEESDTSEIIRLCRTAVDYGSTDLIYYYYLGIAYFQQDKYKDALNAIQQGIKLTDTKSNNQVVYNMYAVSGDIYHMIDNDERAFQSYDTCLIMRPDDPLVLNNYAYYLSLLKKDLKRAEAMSKKSIDQEPENATYLDTYAWVLFQQRRYSEAKVMIDSVMTILGDSISADDAGLVEHAGDIYAQCGQIERAVELWQQALDLGHNVDIISEKIRKRKYFEPKKK